MRKEKLTDFKGLLGLIGEERKNLNLIIAKAKKSDNPTEIRSLITKCKKLAKETNDPAFARLVPKLRLILSSLHKRKQQKRLDHHWRNIQKKNIEFSREMRQQLNNFRKQFATV